MNPDGSSRDSETCVSGNPGLFVQHYPHITELLGPCASQLDTCLSDLNGMDPGQRREHYRKCRLEMWCSKDQMDRTGLQGIDWALGLIKNQVGLTALRKAYSRKAVNGDQFEEMVAEIVVAAAGALHGRILELEWKTRRGNKDVDVRVEFCGVPVNIEVTRRSDEWPATVKPEDVPTVVTDGILFPPGSVSTTGSQLRPTITESERDRLEEEGRVLGPPMPGALDAIPEHHRVRGRVLEKVTKFPEGEVNVVVICSNTGSPDRCDVADAVYGTQLICSNRECTGNMKTFAPGGLFGEDGPRQLWGAVFINHWRLLSSMHQRSSDGLSKNHNRNGVFVNPYASNKPDPAVAKCIARAFDGELHDPNANNFNPP